MEGRFLVLFFHMRWNTTDKCYSATFLRYLDDGFMTTNLPRATMLLELERAKAKDINIGITYSIGTSVDYLDVAIENRDGQLNTSVFHKPAAEPCVLTLITSGYPLKFINNHFRRFFQVNQAQPVFELLDRSIYDRLHTKLLEQPTRREKMLPQQQNESIDMAEYLPTKKPWNRERLIFHSRFESGPLKQYRRQLRRSWDKYYGKVHPRLKDVHLTVGSRTNPPLEYRLVKKKPSRTLLV